LQKKKCYRDIVLSPTDISSTMEPDRRHQSQFHLGLGQSASRPRSTFSIKASYLRMTFQTALSLEVSREQVAIDHCDNPFPSLAITGRWWSAPQVLQGPKHYAGPSRTCRCCDFGTPNQDHPVLAPLFYLLCKFEAPLAQLGLCPKPQ